MSNLKRTLVSRDAIMNADKTTVARLTVKLFDSMSSFYEKKSEQLMALAASFVLMAEAAGFDPFEAYTAVKNLMVDEVHSERRDHRFAAMKYHLETEVLVPNA
jgi:hypothetical protein